MMMNRKIVAYISIVLSMICWSLSFVWIKIAFEAYDPITIVLLRLIASSLLLFPIGISIKKVGLIRKEDIKWFFLLSFFEPFLYFMGESFGLQLVSSTLGSVIISTIPLFCPIAGYFIYREKIDLKFGVGLLISIIGVSVIVFNSDFTLNAPLKGIALLFMAVFAAVGYSTILKNVAAKYNPLHIIAWQNLIGIIFFIPLFFRYEWIEFKEIVPSREVIMAIVKLAIFASSLAFIFFTYSINRLGIAKANIFCNLIPVFTAFFAYIILGEAISTQKAIGISIVISGLLLSQIKIK